MDAISKVATVLYHNPVLMRIVPAVRETGILQAVREICEPSRREHDREERASFSRFYQENESSFLTLREMLEDDFSKKTLDNVIQYRLSGKRKFLKEIFVRPQYFQKDILTPDENEVFIDGGSYVGETVMGFIQNFATGDHWKIYCWEPDEKNYSMIEKVLPKKYRARIRLVKCGMWSEEMMLNFQANGGAASKISACGNIQVPVSSIDRVHKDEHVTFIKMDIEGAEIEALKGAKHIIQRDKPKLAICIYHRPSDLFEIPFLIKSLVPEYKFYMRHHLLDICETVIYATL